MTDVVVFDDPALAPIDSDQAYLFGSRRSPWGCRMAHSEAAHRNIVSMWLVRVEHCLADIDLDRLLVGIGVIKLRPEGCICFVHFSEPERHLASRSFLAGVLRCLNARQTVRAPSTGLILILKEDHDCHPPVFGIVLLPRSSPSGDPRRTSTMPPSVADAARTSISPVFAPKSMPS